MGNSKAVSTPIVSIHTNTNLNDETSDTRFPYRELVGNLQYLTSKTRPDIAFAVNYGTKNIGIQFSKQNAQRGNELIGYSDSDFAGDVSTRKSTTGFVIFYGNGPISWCSHKQSIVALSTTESEYIAAAECYKIQQTRLKRAKVLATTTTRTEEDGHAEAGHMHRAQPG
ncbi:uncharacterized protein LOC143209270 [Lasioglossum baleicum]|uniref:uncharacterized protein LOC143209270 n=1 Tax=Lasioglossum baleicum TaxID=434251 RepID=UPI003FCD1AED